MTLYLQKKKLVTPQEPIKDPWMTNVLLNSSKTNNKLYADAMKGIIHLKIYNKYKNKFTTLVKVSKEKYFSNFANMHTKNSKAIWNLLNVKLGNSWLNKTRSIPNISPDGLENMFAELGSKTKSQIKPIN